MKTKILKPQESYDVALVVGESQKIILKEFYKVTFTALLISPLQSSYPLSYLPCLIILCLKLEHHSYL